jgi:predicted RNase H-like HicB family nuclease
MRPYVVIRVAWDADAQVWFVEDSDVPGLATEAETLDGLRAKLPGMIADLLEGRPDRPNEIEMDVIAHARERVRFAA